MNKKDVLKTVSMDVPNLKIQLTDHINNHPSSGGADNVYKKLPNEVYSSTRLQSFVDERSFIILSKDDYVFDKVVKLGDNKFIFIEEGATITLKDGCNEYIFENKDLVNGNKNITIIGGIFNGKGNTMTRKFDGATLEGDYYGFGLHFFKVKNLELRNMEIYETNAWAIAHNLCDGVVVDNIFVWQLPIEMGNGDGITGQSKNVRISNISGYTNDDMVGFGGFGATLGRFIGDSTYVDIKIPKQNAENYIIENITGMVRDDKACWRGVAMYQRDGYAVKNVKIKNVNGTFKNGATFIYGFQLDKATPTFENIYMEQIEGVSTEKLGTICINAGSIKDLIIENATVNRDTNYAYLVIGYLDNAYIRNLSINGITETTTGGSIVHDKGECENITMTNVTRTTKSTTEGTTLYLRDNRAGQTVIPKINISGSNFTWLPTYYFPIKILGDKKISLCCTDFFVNETLLSPNEYDIIFSKNGGVAWYKNGVWNYTVGASKSSISTGLTAEFTCQQTAFTKIIFNSTRFANGLALNNGAVTVSKSGLYKVIGCVGTRFATSKNSRITVSIFVNDVEYSWIGQQSILATDYANVNGECVISLNSGDKVDIRCAINSDVANDRILAFEQTKTYFQVVEL